MRKRTEARECALQILYQIDITQGSCEECMENFWQSHVQIEPQVKNFAELLIRGTIGNIKDIDEKIAKYAANWQLKRMAAVDRNVLRLAIYELCYLKDIPRKVSINEAVDLAKKFSSPESGKFVNGILDSLSKKECADKL